MVVNSVAPVILVGISQSAGGNGKASGLGGEVNRAPANRSTGIRCQTRGMLSRSCLEFVPKRKTSEIVATSESDLDDEVDK